MRVEHARCGFRLTRGVPRPLEHTLHPAATSDIVALDVDGTTAQLFTDGVSKLP